jgi:uncharacterized protein
MEGGSRQSGENMQARTQDKHEALQAALKRLQKVVIGFSGGIDSTVILKAAIDTLGCDNVWAVTGDSESLLPEELEQCRELSRIVGLSPSHFIEIKTNELSNPN